MDILNQIVQGLTKEEIRFYKLLAMRTQSGNDRKDVKLFDEMRKKGEGFDEAVFLKKYYLGQAKNAYYRLKNRLLNDVAESLVLHHFSDDEQSYALHLLALENHFSTQNKFKIAHYFLKKAESLALKNENFQLLDIIYAEYIKLSHELFQVNPELYIHKRTANLQNINSHKQIDDILAAVAYRLKTTQNFKQGDVSIMQVLQKTIDDFSNDAHLKKSPVLRLKLYQAVSQLLLQRRAYVALEEYLIKLYNDFKTENLFTKANHDTHLQMLTYIVNSLFKNHKIRESLQYAEQLRLAMEQFNNLHYDKYFFYYYNSLVINYSVIDKAKAIEILNQLKSHKQIKSNQYYEIFVHLNLAVQHYDIKQYHEAIRALNKLCLLQSYKATDNALKFKIALADLIIRVELQDFDIFEYKLAQMRKDFAHLLQEKAHAKEAAFTKLMVALAKQPWHELNTKTKAKVVAFIDEYSHSQQADDEILSYVAWLKTKVKH